MSTEEKSSPMFSGTAKNLILAFIFAAYLLAGAYIFQILEKEAELKVKVKTERHKLDFLKNYTCLTEDAVKQLINVVTEAVQQGINPLANGTTSHQTNWDFGSSFFFAGTVVTTIGYGTIAPRTVGGQVFCIAYALFGIPLNIIVLSHVGKSLSLWCKGFAKILVKKGIKKKTAKVLTIIFFLLMGMIIFLGIPPLLFSKTEGWTYEEGVYYAFISLTTIGFGDYVVGSGKRRTAPFQGYRALVCFWILFGLAWLSLLINLLTSLLEDTEKLAEDIRKKVKHRKERKQETALLEKMSEFSLDDAIAGQTNASGQQTQTEGQNWNNQWGGQPYPGGYQAPGQGQQYPGAPPGGQPYPGGFPAGGQQYPGAFPPGGQQYPGAYPGFPGFPAPGQQYPGGPVPGQPTDPKAAGQAGPSPSGPFPSAPAGPLKVPYHLPLQAGMMPGLVVTIQGVVNPNAQRFAIDFKIRDDIVFHLNPRFNEHPNVIVRNSMINGRWGAEERGAPKFPFNKGQAFMMQISVDQTQFSVSVNNENILQFRHRNKDLQQIKNVVIHGDITLNGVNVCMM